MSVVTELGKNASTVVGQVTGTVTGTAKGLYPTVKSSLPTVTIPAVSLKSIPAERIDAVTKPLYAFAGATEYVVEQVKGFSAEIPADMAKLRTDATAEVAKLQQTITSLPVLAKAVATQAQTKATELSDTAQARYTEFAVRGEKIVTIFKKAETKAEEKAEAKAQAKVAPKAEQAKKTTVAKTAAVKDEATKAATTARKTTAAKTTAAKKTVAPVVEKASEKTETASNHVAKAADDVKAEAAKA